jgi:hypothetical protein
MAINGNEIRDIAKVLRISTTLLSELKKYQKSNK